MLSPHRRSDSDGVYTTRKVQIFEPFGTASPELVPSPPLGADNTGLGSGSRYGRGHGSGTRGRPPFQHTTSNGSISTLPVAAAAHADRNKPFAGTGLVALNASDPTISTVTYPPGVPVPTSSPPGVPGHGHTHTHTLSGHSTLSQSSVAPDTREGAISPYVLPPVPAVPAASSHGEGRTRSSPGSPGHHAKGSSGSAQSGGSGGEYFSTVPAPTAHTASRTERERRNPPAYSPEPEDLGLAFGDAGHDSVMGNDSLDAQVGSRTTRGLSGTTLLQGSVVQSAQDSRSEAAGGARRDPMRRKRPY